MKSAALFAAILTAAAATGCLATGPTQFEVALSGITPSQVADVSAMGIAVIKISLVGEDYKLDFQITTANLTLPLPPLFQHIHRGTAAETGPVVVNIPGTWQPRNGGAQWVMEGQIPNTGAIMNGNMTYTEVINALRADPAGFYVNVHTPTWPDGAIRGQVSDPPASIFNVSLSGLAPAQIADVGATGTVLLEITNQNGQYRVQYFFTAFNLTVPLPPTMQHIHQGTILQTGPVVLVFVGSWSQRGAKLWGMQGEIQNADIAVVNGVLANPAVFYVNVHTSTFPSGAIRGQI